MLTGCNEFREKSKWLGIWAWHWQTMWSLLRIMILCVKSIKYLIKEKCVNCAFCFPDLLKVIADPERDGCAPVTVPWNRPVSCISQPVPKTFLTYKFWNPVETKCYILSGFSKSLKIKMHSFDHKDNQIGILIVLNDFSSLCLPREAHEAAICLAVYW